MIGQPLLSGHAPHATLAQPGVARAVAGAGVYLATLSLFSLATAVLIRHGAAAIAVIAAVAFVLPTATSALPSSLKDAAAWLPTNAGSTLWAVRHTAHALPTVGGYALFLTYTAILLTAARVMLARHDS